MIRLTTLAARPRKVTLAGVQCLAAKLRVGDLADLESWMAEVIAPPAPGQGPAGAWPPTIDSPAAIRLLQSGKGTARLILASLGQTVEGMDERHAREIAREMRPGEVGPFFSAIFPEPDPDSREGIPREGRPEARPRGPANWHARFVALARTYGYTPAQILDLPLDQFFAMGRQGTQPRYPGSRGGPRRTVRSMRGRLTSQAIIATANSKSSWTPSRWPSTPTPPAS